MSPELWFAVVALGLSLVGTLIGCIGLVLALRSRKWPPDGPIDWPPTWQDIVNANGGTPPAARELTAERRIAANYRHALRCLKCGRFAKQAPDLPPGVSECKLHGYSLTISTQPIPIVRSASCAASSNSTHPPLVAASSST